MRDSARSRPLAVGPLSPHIAKGPIRSISLDDNRLIIAGAEKFWFLASKSEQHGNCRQLRSTILPFVHQRLEQRGTLFRHLETPGEIRDGRLSLREINRTSIVGIDKIEVP